MKSKKITYKHIVAILFSAFILFYFVTIGERVVRSSLLGQNLDENIQAEIEYNPGSVKLTDWVKMYPPQEDGNTDSAPEEEITQTSTFDRIKSGYTDTAMDLEERVDYFTSKLLFLRMKFVELNSYFNKFIGNKLISGSDEVIVMGDGNLTYTPYEHDMTASAEHISDFSEYLKERGIDLLYVQAPSKVDPENNYLPNGITDYDNINADSFINMIKKNGVNYLDLRQSMKQQGMDFTESFYKTDHHWKTGTALWASDQIAKKIAEYGIPYSKELLDINNYNEKVYKKYMLGSLGKKVSLAFADPEDFSLYTPKFDTDYTVNYYDYKTTSGSFKDAIVNMDVLKKIDYYNSMVYSSYLYGVFPVVSIENHMADNDKRILLINDSFGNSVAPFLSTQVRHIDKLDLRYFAGGVKAFIEKNKPDIVIVLYYPTTLASNSECFALNFR